MLRRYLVGPLLRAQIARVTGAKPLQADFSL
jgi:hypothetical protein